MASQLDELDEPGWSEQSKAVIEQLTDRLDPIDWSFQEKYLWENMQRHVQRSSMLFGAMGALMHKAAGAQPTPSSADVKEVRQLLAIAEPAPRFMYLPVNTMVFLTDQRTQKRSAEPQSANADAHTKGHSITEAPKKRWGLFS